MYSKLPMSIVWAAQPPVERRSRSTAPCVPYQKSTIIEILMGSLYQKNPTMRKALENWEETCDKLVTSPLFAAGWGVPAYFPLYNFHCVASLEAFFQEKYKQDPSQAALYDQRLEHASKQHAAWERAFFDETSPQCVPFTKCIWYHEYYMIHELKQPELWQRFFGNGGNVAGDHTDV